MKPLPRSQLPWRLCALAAIALAVAACKDSAAQPPPSPPPEVSVIVAHARSVPLTHELVGRLAPTRVAQVRARVAGIILRRTYTEGTDVKQGQVLFEIDPAPLEASLHAAEAALAKARADATNAALIAKRYRDLHARKLLSQQDLDTALANERTTAAAVQEARANVEKARLDLGYATVRAPIAGRAGRALVTEGALVGQGEPTQLTTVEQIDPIYVNFGQPWAEFQKLRELQAAATAGGSTPAVQLKPRVEVVLPDGTTYPHPGTLDFYDLAVDPATNTVSLRAVLPNPDHRLLPGMFVNVRLTSGRLEHAYLLPQAALARDSRGAYVLVVNPAGKVEQRRVQTHGMTRTDWIVTGALGEGERVIVEGLQKVRPGATATAVPAGTARAETAASPGKH